MNRKIAVPVASALLCPHFGHCEQFFVYDVEDSTVVKEARLTPPPHEPGVLPKWLAENNVTDVISGGMGQRAINIFNQENINVFVGAPSIPPSEIISQFLSGTLETRANLCDH